MTLAIDRNVTAATVMALREIASNGQAITIRGHEVREVRNRVTVMRQPRERCLFLPNRGNNVFAAVAEAFWVLAGRNDITWLETYLPRARDFSDDGLTWRAGYGPRIRDWNGVDQVDEVRKQLLADRPTRRAAMSIYDPDRDFVKSNDIPCNNWLHWLVRNDRLHLNVAIRSSDVWWGFSGVNAFEWSILQEVLAFWIGAEVGDMTFFASSLHLYQRHYDAAARVLASYRAISCYDFGLAPPNFSTRWEEFGRAMAEWFTLEEEVRSTPDREIPDERLPRDELLRGAIQILRVYHGAAKGWNTARLREELHALPENDLTAAAYEHFARKSPAVIDGSPHARITAFLVAYRTAEAPAFSSIANHVLQAIKTLHRRKDAAYSNSWKRRGELTSILANVARKVDRLENYARHATPMVDESIVDTAVDLLVYVTKYRLFLLEGFPASEIEKLLPHAPTPLSDHCENFDRLLDQLSLPDRIVESSRSLTKRIETLFEQIHLEASSTVSEPAVRLELATRLSALSLQLVAAFLREHPDRIAFFRDASN